MKKLIQNEKYDFRNKYFADDNGHIWSEYKQDYLKEYDDKNGYKKVLLMTTDKPNGKGHRFSVHRLILKTFNPIPYTNDLQVDHINGNHQDNRLVNLRWVTPSENLNNPNTKPNRRVYDQNGTHNASAKFDKELLLKLIIDVNSGNFKRKDILNKYQICNETLKNIIDRKSYYEDLKDIEINPNFISDYSRDTSGEKNGRSKLTETQVKEIIELLLSKSLSNVQIAKKYNVSAATISHIKSKDTWKYLTENITFN